MTTPLSTTQLTILRTAIQSSFGHLSWFPPKINGGARKKVLHSLLQNELIIPNGSNWCVTPKAYDALGLQRPAPARRLSAFEAKLDEVIQNVQAQNRLRQNTKQSQVIEMLKRPEGATIAQICAATGWQAHTVRGTFAGAFKKKLGLSITSDKAQGCERIYRIASTHDESAAA